MAQLKHPKMVDIRDILDENTRLPALVAASASAEATLPGMP